MVAPKNLRAIARNAWAGSDGRTRESSQPRSKRMGRDPMAAPTNMYTFERNATIDRIRKGSYGNIRLFHGPRELPNLARMIDLLPSSSRNSTSSSSSRSRVVSLTMRAQNPSDFATGCYLQAWGGQASRDGPGPSPQSSLASPLAAAS